MTEWGLATAAVALLGFALLSRRLAGSVVTPAMFFVTMGLLIGPDALDALDVSVQSQVVTALVNATLTVVLFSDAAGIDRARLRREYSVPARLLGVGLPLTILAGTLAGLWLLDGMELWPAALLAAILAPTDAALGQVVVTSPALPSRIRQGLNVESGLNDGICVPLIAIFTTLALSAEGMEGSEAIRIIAEEIGFGALGGVIAGIGGAWLLAASARRDWIDASWHQIAFVAVPALAFGIAVPLHGSGFIAAFVAGVVFGAMSRRQGTDSVALELPEQVGDVLGALTFLVFGAIVLSPSLDELTWPILAYALLSLTLIRMIPVAASFLGTGARRQTVAFVGWFGPRGLASIVFAMALVAESELEQRGQIIVVVAVTVSLSVFLHGLSAAPGANRYAAWYRSHPRRTGLMESQSPTR